MSNQEAKRDAGKIRPTLVPRQIIRAIAVVRGYGCEKYPNGGQDNWKQVEAERYRDALCRHLLAYLDDPNGVDAESGYPHSWHAATNLAFLIEKDCEVKTVMEKAENHLTDLDGYYYNGVVFPSRDISRILNTRSEDMTYEEAKAAVKYYRKVLAERIINDRSSS